MRKIKLASVLIAAALFSAASLAQSGQADGEVRRVDKDQAKITLRHGPITGALEMPAMNMVFRVRDPALLDKLKAGDKGRFAIAKDAQGYWIEGYTP